jgi:hypothetical protein
LLDQLDIQKYLNKFDANEKCFLLLTIAPKNHYPLKSYGDEFENYVEHIFQGEDKYIGLFDPDRKEILQDVAFKIYTMPLIGDSYDIRSKHTNKVKRATKEDIEAFVIIQEFFNTVPYGELKEVEAIAQGMQKAEDFLNKFSLTDHEITITKHGRHEDGTQSLIKMEFNCSNGYYFDTVYVR